MSNDNKSKEKPIDVKIILVGNISVGKTCLIHHYLTGEFLENIPSTQDGVFHHVEKQYNNQKYNLNFWDTAGQEKYRALTKSFMRNAQIVILVYSIVDKKSFDDLDNWLQMINDNIGKDGYILGIAGNKNDLYKEAEVKSPLGENYANENEAIFRNTSAKDKCGIRELIEELFKDYIKKSVNGKIPKVQPGSKLVKKSKKKFLCC